MLWILWTNGLCSISSSAFMFSLGTLAVKFLEPGVPAFEVACIPAVVSWVILAALLVLNKEVSSKDWNVRMLTVLRGVFGAASLSLYYMSIEMLPLKNAVTLFFCSPVISAMLEWLITGESLGTGSIVGCMLTVLGVFLVTQPQSMGGGNKVTQNPFEISPGVLIALLAATCNAIAFVIVRALKGRQSALVLTYWQQLIIAVVTGSSLLLKKPAAAVMLTGVQMQLLLGVCVAQFFGQILLNRGFQLLSATRGSAINVLQVLFSYVWELTVLKESTNLTSISGGLFVMAGVMVVALTGKEKSEADLLDDLESISEEKRSVSRSSSGRLNAVPSAVLPFGNGPSRFRQSIEYVLISTASDGHNERFIRHVRPGATVPTASRLVSPGSSIFGALSFLRSSSAVEFEPPALQPSSRSGTQSPVPVQPWMYQGDNSFSDGRKTGSQATAEEQQGLADRHQQQSGLAGSSSDRVAAAYGHSKRASEAYMSLPSASPSPDVKQSIRNRRMNDTPRIFSTELHGAGSSEALSKPLLSSNISSSVDADGG